MEGDKGTVTYSIKQEMALLKIIIKQEANVLRRKYSRWSRSGLILNSVGENDEELQNSIVSEANADDFDLVEWGLTLNQTLLPKESCVIRGIYLSNFPQRVVAHRCLLSQATVSRLHKQALTKLKMVIKA